MRRIVGLGSLALVACGKEPPPPTPAVAAPAHDAAPAVPDAAAADASPPDAGPPPVLTLERVPRPGADDAWRFFDDNGENLVVVTTTKVTGPETEMGLRQTWRLRVDHSVTSGDRPRTLRTIRDAVVDCDVQITLDLQGLELDDVDGDRIGEIVLGYEMGCRSDASSNTLKVMLLENGRKFVLRGWTRVHTQGDSTMGGDVVPDADSESIPRRFRARLDTFWSEVVDDDYLSGEGITEDPPSP
jgi:hypothetical protein